jgi:hypothetical protein
MFASAWSTQQLAEFLAAVSSAETEAAAAWATVERTAEELDAEVAAIVSGGQLLAAVGYPDGAAPVAELAAVTPGVEGQLAVPGLGVCSATAVRLEQPLGASLVVARCGTGLSPQEASLLRGIAHATDPCWRVSTLGAGCEDASRSGRDSGGRAPVDGVSGRYFDGDDRVARQRPGLRRRCPPVPVAAQRDPGRDGA